MKKTDKMGEGLTYLEVVRTPGFNLKKLCPKATKPDDFLSTEFLNSLFAYRALKDVLEMSMEI